MILNGDARSVCTSGVNEMNNIQTKLVQSLDSHETISIKTLDDVKYQDISYYKQNGDEIIESDDHNQIDFIKAISEMEKLDWKLFNYIGFHNHKNQDLVQFIRKNENNWYAEVPINHGKNWDWYYWAAEADNETIASMMRLFFEEVPWFGMLSWKMGRAKN